jgi:hypothetical protein
MCDKVHDFDGWFPGLEACDKQLSAGLVNCPDCNSTKVRKALMAPAVATKKQDSPMDKRQVAMAAQQAVMAKLREHVENNFEHVGDRFPEEARRIHYGETEKRDIYGEASVEEARELVEEGVEIAPLPGPSRTDA